MRPREFLGTRFFLKINHACGPQAEHSSQETKVPLRQQYTRTMEGKTWWRSMVHGTMQLLFGHYHEE